MLDKIGITIDVRGGNVGVANEIEFPEAVIASHSGCLPESRFRQPHFSRAAPLQVIFRSRRAQEPRHFLGRPRPMGL